MPDLEELRRAVFPTAAGGAPARGATALRDVVWVRVLKARVPAFDALDRGDLAILPETALRSLAAGGLEPGAIVDALDRAGAAGALLVGEGDADPIAAATLRRATELKLPAWRLAGPDPAQVERSVIGYLVNARAELERRAADLEDRLAALALEGRDLAAHAALIATFLGRAVAIEGAEGQAVAVHAPAGVPSAAADAAGYLANRRHVALRTPLPGPAAEASGALVVLGAPPATELERLAGDRVAALLALELARDQAGRRPTEARRRADALPGDGPPWVVLMARQLIAGTETTLDERERLRERVARLAPARRLRLRGDAGSLELRVVVAAGAADPLGLTAASRVAETAGRPVAASRPFHRPEDRPLAEEEARATLEAAANLPLDAASGLVVRADRLPSYRLLGSLHNLPDGVRHARALLTPILVGRPEVQAERLSTLRAVLERPGLAEAAAALGIHRNTLAYRVARIEALGGWRLDDPELRFVLALAARLVQTAQEEG